jgi:hypothetical protein
MLLGSLSQEEMGGTYSTHWRDACKMSVGKPKGKILLERPIGRWADNIKIDLKEIICRCGVDSTGTGQNIVVGFCEHDNESSGFVKDIGYIDKQSKV